MSMGVGSETRPNTCHRVAVNLWSARNLCSLNHGAFAQDKALVGSGVSALVVANSVSTFVSHPVLDTADT